MVDSTRVRRCRWDDSSRPDGGGTWHSAPGQCIVLPIDRTSGTS